MAEDDNPHNPPKNGKLNLSDLTPEEIAQRLLDTPPPPKREHAKERRQAKREGPKKSA